MKALLIGGAGASGVPIAAGLEQRGYTVTILHRGVHEPDEIARFRHIHADPHFASSVSSALNGETFDAVVLAYGRVAQLAPLFAGRCDRLVAIGGIPIYAGYLDPKSQLPQGMALLQTEYNRVNPAQMKNPEAAKFASKMIAAEDAVMKEYHNGGYSASIVRYPQIYGPRSLGGSECSLMRRVSDRRQFMLLPNAGLGIIARCSAENAAWAVLAALETDAAQGLAFNIADEEQFTLAGWLELALECLGASIEFIPLPPQLNWVAAHLLPLGGTTSAHGLVDISLARAVLGFSDQIAVRDALSATLQWRMQDKQVPASPGDQLDYALEDQVRTKLDELVDEFSASRFDPPVVHPYPHPRTPSLAADHRGR